MGTPPSLRVPEEMMRSWVDVLLPRTDLRGAAAVAKEMEALLSKAQEGHVAVSRHQLFTWQQAVEGMARRTPLGSPVGQVAEDLRAVLGSPGGPTGAAPARLAPERSDFPASASPHAVSTPAPYVLPTASPPSRAPAPAGPVQFLGPDEIRGALERLIREARAELRIVSPWRAGLETLVQPLLERAQAGVRVRVLSRPSEGNDATYHRDAAELQRRRVDLAMSNALHTRMVIQDDAWLLLGSATLPPPGVPLYRESAVLTRDPAAVASAKSTFERLHGMAREGK